MEGQEVVLYPEVTPVLGDLYLLGIGFIFEDRHCSSIPAAAETTLEDEKPPPALGAQLGLPWEGRIVERFSHIFHDATICSASYFR